MDKLKFRNPVGTSDLGLKRLLMIVMLLVGVGQMAWADYSGIWDEQSIADSEAPTHELEDGRYVFHINNARQMAWFAHQYILMKNNNVEKERYRKAKLVLEGEIDLEGHYWRALGETCYSFAGEIDGKGNVIRNMYCTSSVNGSQHGGLINVVDGNFKARDLRFVDCKNVAGEYEAMLVGLIQNGDELEVDNISFDNCFVDGQRSCGMVAGEIYKVKTVTLKNVTVRNSCVSPRWGGGGVVGIVNGAKSLAVSNVKVSGTGQNSSTIYATRDMNSCVIGAMESCRFDISDITIDHCVMRAYSNNDNKGKMWGMLVGFIKTSSGDISNVTVNEGELHDGGDYVGGLIGWHDASGTNNLISVNNCRVDNLRIWLMGDYRYCGGLIGEAQGVWNIKNCFAEVDFVRHGGYCGGLVGKTYGSYTNVTLRNCIAHTYTQYFSDSNPHWANGGLVGGVSSNSHVDINACGVITETYSKTNNSVGILVGGLNEGGSLSGGNCFVTNSYKNQTDDDIRQVAFGDEVRRNGKFTFGKVYPYLVESWSETSDISHSAAMMNERGACLGVQKHGADTWNRRQYVPLDDPQKGMVVRYANAQNVAWVKGRKFMQDYGRYGDYAIMAVGDTMSFEMNPLPNQWYINNNSTAADKKDRQGAYLFSMVPQPTDKAYERTISFDIANVPQVEMSGHYDAIRQRSNLSWTASYPNGDKDYNLWKGARWEVHREGSMLTDTISLGNCSAKDLTPKVDTDNNKNLNNYYVALTSKEHFLGFNEGNASKSHAQYQIHANDEIRLDNKGKKVYEGIQLTTEVPNSKRFDNCKVNLYRWDNETAQMIVQSIKQGNPTFTHDQIVKAFADTLRHNYAHHGIARMEVAQFHFDANLKDSLVKVTYTDNPSNICSNFNYIYCCENFTDDYYKQFGAIFSEQYKYVPDSEVSITSLEASKGESPTKVKLSWKSKLSRNNLSVRYILRRKIYTEADSRLSLAEDTVAWDSIYEVTNTYTTNTHTDETLPGYVYRYRVDASIACDGVMNSEYICASSGDIGFSASRGTIMGKVTYSNGNSRVKGVDVVLTTDKESMHDVAVTSKVRSFKGKTDYLPLARGVGESFWSQDWTLQFILRPTANGRVVSLPGKMAVDYKDNMLCMAGKTMPASGTNYNHIIINHIASNSKTSQPAYYRMGYVKRPDTNDEDQTYEHYSEIVTEEEMMQWMNSQLETTFADELAFGCPSATSGDTRSFKGLLDEVRLWSKILDKDEIRKTFDRYILGSETKLMAYYSFDEGVRDKVFDTSHPSEKWNNRHADVEKYDIATKEYLPDLETRNDMESVLCYRGVSDEQGLYQIVGIPYVGEGTNYKVTPVFGTHEFYPASTRRFVSGSSLVHSEVDFADRSSFHIPVVAVYSGTTLPASGLMVTVDGAPVTNEEGFVMTNAQGKAVVSVPIGSHKLKLEANGHELANGGYACNISVDDNGNVKVTQTLQDKDGYQDFQHDLVAPLTFYDNTRVSLCGHVVGGSVENEKLLGGGLTKNNIGRTTITLKPENLDGYYVSADGKDHDYSLLGNAGLKSKVLYKKETIEITTDSLTGEYYAMLPPVGYRVMHVKSVNVKHGTALDDTDFQLDKISTSLNFDVGKTSYDSVEVKKDSLVYTTYNLKKNFACYVDPTLEVYNPFVDKKDSLMMGEQSYDINYVDKDGKEVKDNIEFWNSDVRDGSSDAYNLKMTYTQDGKSVKKGFPVFEENKTYKVNIKLYDSYLNRENGVCEKYNLEGVNIRINNGLAAEKFKILVTDTSNIVVSDTTTITTEADTISTKSGTDGILGYEFVAGFPTTTFPYTQKLEFSYEANGVTYTGEPIEGIVLGCVPVPGKKFVTEGPNEVDFVLRDPPGSHSFSWLDVGTTIGNTYTYSHGAGFDFSTTFAIGDYSELELDHVVADPTGLSAASFKKLYSSLKAIDDHGFSVSLKGSGGKTNTVTYTINSKLQTSSDAGFVGDDGDIYVGRSNNVLISSSRNLDFCQITAEPTEKSGILKSKNGVSYQLLDMMGYAQGTKFKTTFAYTQKHILNTLIPDLRKTRRSMCIEVDNFDNTPLVGDTTTYYVLKGVSDDKDQWVEGVDYKWIVKDSENDNNHIQTLCSWIAGWKNEIAANEEVKYKAFKEFGNSVTRTWTDKEAVFFRAPTLQYGYLGNISLDGGTTNTATFNRSYVDNYSDAVAWSAGEQNTVYKSFEWTHVVKGNRLSITIKPNVGASGNYNRSELKTYTQNMGYTISDANGGDYLSINTYLPKTELKTYKSGTFGPVASTVEIPAMNEFFVFRLVGGQTKCPYEGVKQSLVYKEDNNSVALSDGSLAVEVPMMKLGTHTLTDVPNGRSVTVPVTLSNESTATITFGPWTPVFDFAVKGFVATDGLQMYIDGVACTTANTQFAIAPGQSITKTLEFKQTKLDVLDYSVPLMLRSDCQSTNAVTDSLSIHFKPASSPVTLKNSMEYVNKESVESPVNFVLEDYEPSFANFAGIRLQRKKQGVNEDFYTIGNVINDSVLVKEILGEIPKGAITIDPKTDTKKLTIPVSMRGISDGTYMYRAVSYSKYGNDEVQTISDTLVIVRDTVGPTLLTRPTPVDGYFTNGSEISLQFNEKINTAKLTDNNFYVTAALNDALVTHRTGLHFDGNAPAKTSSRIDILGKSTTLGFWYKPQVGKRSCLFSQDVVNKSNVKVPVALYYNEDGSMTIKCGGDSVRSTKKATRDGRLISDWMYAVLTVDRNAAEGNGMMTLYNLFGTSNIDESTFITIRNTNTNYNTNVPLYIGGSAEGDGCYADIEGFVVYDDAKPFADVTSDKSNKHVANTRGLQAYWPMDEGNGNVAHDKVFSRNLTLQGTDNWYTPVLNYALNLNGVDQYLSLKTSSIGITKLEDYAIEFWFRSETDEKREMALFSCGYGGSKRNEAVDARMHLSLLLGSEGQIILNASGKTYEMGKGYNDREWHHLALSVPRDGYVALMVDTIDICTNTSILGDSLGALERADMQIGALVFYDEGGMNCSDFFEGRIDEVRIWNALKTIRNIKANAFNRLGGDEAGLVAYYPFEYSMMVANQETTFPTIGDRAQADNIPGLKPADDPDCHGFVAESAVVQNGALLKAADFQSPIMINWVDDGDDRIVISFPDDLSKARMEGCVVNFQLKNVEDMAGNQQRQPVSWSVYVWQNTLRWVAPYNELKTVIGGADTTTVILYNDSPTAQTWDIVGVPSWLKLSQTSGMIAPFGYSRITAQTLESNAMGTYQATMYLVGNDGIYEPLNMTLAVTGEKPAWDVATTDNEIWMTIMGRLKVGNTWSADENTMVGVFVKEGDEAKCLAVASPKYNEEMSAYFVNFNIKGNASLAKKKLYLRVWDSQSGLIYTHTTLNYKQNGREITTDSIAFINQSIVGNFTYPCIISTDNQISQTLSLHAGWNWISLWITPDEGLTGKAVFGKALKWVDEVKSRFGDCKKESDINNMKLELSKAYHVHATSAVEITLQGTMADARDVDIVFTHSDAKGQTSWKWLGFPIRTTMTLAEALADLAPSTNDVIKSEDAFAMYNGKSWIGDLKYLSPGSGYVYGYNKSTNTTWHYPGTANAIVASEGDEAFRLEVDPYSYEDFTAVEITVLENASPYYAGYQLGAFTSDGVCHGVADSDEDGKCNICIFGEADELYTFKLYDKKTLEIIELDGFKYADYVTPLQQMTLTVDYTGVNDFEQKADDGQWYDLNGIRVDKNSKMRGIILKKKSKTIRN